MKESIINLIHNEYSQTEKSTTLDILGMREMQARVFEKRNSNHLIIKAPPASGKSRALMYVAIDKLFNQGRKKVIVAVPERSIGSSFESTKLTESGFYADWEVEEKFNLCLGTGDDKSKVTSFVNFMKFDSKILICTHATLRYAFDNLNPFDFNNCVLAIDEFHHVSTSEDSRLGELLHNVMRGSNVQIIAMTGSYFRGDAVPILTPEDEINFDKVTYTYYEQLNGYRYLKSLGIGYHFYTGNYLDKGALDNVLDTTKKTIIHIPNVNSKESTPSGKLEEVYKIYDIIGDLQSQEIESGIDLIKTTDGRILRVANLVDDNPIHRNKVVGYLQKIARNNLEAVDIIIALGMAKEGFDWPFCEQALTIGYRSSLTEIVQIIGRCTRDSSNKTHAQFTNLIVMPNGTDDAIQISVNNMLKAITVSLLMEQVLAPNFTFTPRTSESQKSTRGEIFIKGLKPPTSIKVKQIIETDLEDLTAAVLQNPQFEKAAAMGLKGDYVKNLQSKIIKERIVGLTDDEVEITRQYLAANIAVKTSRITEDGDKKFITMANSFVNLDDLTIDLIDSINPFQNAFEVIGKKMGADAFRLIQDTIEGSRIIMDENDALALVPLIKSFIQANGRHPELNSIDKNEKLLAQARAYLTAKKAEYMRSKNNEQ